ncbi:MAG: gliding motility-associated C-terminal domain-containing protein [Bacteroidales bacterium]|nr:gliding motility-associated C-terminal domain-containing protein [Bacteroidales bacterium]
MKNRISPIHFLSIVFCFLILNTMTAQTTTAFRKNYNQAMFDLPGNIVEGLTANTYVMAGTNMSFIPIYGTVSQINDTGAVTWSYRYSDGSIGFQLNDIKKDVVNNQYITCGGSESNAAVFMVLDAAGVVIIQKKFIINEANTASFNRVIKASDGGYVAVGYVTGYDPDGAGPEIKFDPITYIDGNGDSQTEKIASPLIVKFDASGNHLWHKVFRYYATSNIPANRIYNDASFYDVVEVSDGYVAVGSYDVNQHLSATNSDGDDATPTDALIVKTTSGGSITYHKQVDSPSNSATQSSKYLSAVNVTSAGAIIAGGYDNGKELIQKFPGSGGFSNTFSRLFTYSSFIGTPDPVDVSQIYEVNGGTDLVTMSMYIKPFSLVFANAIHKVNSTATSNVWAKRYDFDLVSILPRGGKTSDNGFITMSMTAGGTNYDYHVIKTDPSGDSPLIGCPATSFTPTAAAGPTTFADPLYNSWSGTPGSNVISISRIAITLTPSYICTKTICVPPAAATTVTATPNPICSGQSTSITASGPSTSVYYNVYTATTGGTNLGSTPLSVSPTSTTTYYVETVSNSDPSCVSTTRTPVTVTVNTPATVSAGLDQTICAGSTVTLAGTIGGGATSATWSGGTLFSPNTTTLNAVYTPSAAQVTAGTATLTLTTNDPSGPCPAVSSTMTITINAIPTVSAGFDQTICAGSTVSLAGTIGGGATSATWSGGTSFSPNATTLNAVYTPTTAQITAGTATLTLTTNNPSGPCPAVNDNVVITINAQPTVDAGTDQSICAGTSAVLSGSFGSTATSATWSGGTGSFSSTSSMNATYTPSAAEVSAGTATLTLTTNDPSGPCTAKTDNVVITINQQPTASAVATSPICQGTSSTLTASGLPGSTYLWNYGAGNTATVSVSPSTSTTYTVSVTDANNCGTATASVVVNVILAPVINTNPDTICKGSTYQISGNISNYASVLWTTSGTGSFSDAAIINPIYSPSTSDNVSGNVVLTVTATGNTPCGISTGQIALALIEPAPPVMTNSDTSLCLNGSLFTLTGLPTGGTFSGQGVSSNQFNPATAGVGSHIITYTISDNHNCINSSTETINVFPLPTANAGVDQTICEGDTAVLSATGLTNSTFVWSHGLGNSSTVSVMPTASTTYTVSVTDENNCGTTTDNVVVTVELLPVITFSPDSICTGNSYQTSVSAANYALVSWSTSGTGQFNNINILNPVYTPSNNDIISGEVTLSITASGNNTCRDVTENITLTILPLPVIDFSDSIAGVCINAVPIVLNTATPSGGSYSGAGVTNGVFNPQSAGVGNHILNYSYTDLYGCNNTESNTIQVYPLPLVSLPHFSNICISDTSILPLLLDAGTPSGGSYSGNFVSNNIFDPGTAGIYPIVYTFTDSNGCINSDTSNISVVSDVTLTSDAYQQNTIYVNLGALINFTAEASFPYSGIYAFFINTNMEQTGNSNLFATNTLTGGDVVYVTLDSACYDSLEIKAKPIPNAFIPASNESQNSIFMPDVDLTVINRWGQELYRGTDGWDGKYKGQDVSPGTYFYIIRIIGLNGEEKQISGIVTLVSNP